MKKVAVFGVLGLLALLAPAQASPHSPAPGKAHSCAPHTAGFNASGTLLSATLTPAGKGRYDGTLEITVTKANHHAPTGDQTFNLAAARVKFHHGVDPATPAPGSRVQLHGKITALPKHCPSEGFAPTITVKKVDIRVKHKKD